MSARNASISWVTRTRCSWVSSQNASKRSVSESIGSSRSGEGLGGAAACGYWGGGGGGLDEDWPMSSSVSPRNPKRA